MLTLKQKELLLFIHERMSAEGVPPSFDEMKDALDLKSKSGIHRLITALVERGFIRRLPHRARAIEVLKLPESAIAAEPQRRRPGLHALRYRRQPHAVAAVGPASTGCRYPHGVGAAHGPDRCGRTHFRHSEPHPGYHLPSGHADHREHFALEVKGDSMIEAGIHDGDTVIIRAVIRPTTAISSSRSSRAKRRR